jgi:hypothetical protein
MTQPFLTVLRFGDGYLLGFGPPRKITRVFESLDGVCGYISEHCEKGEVNLPELRKDLEHGLSHTAPITAECAVKMGFDPSPPA